MLNYRECYYDDLRYRPSDYRISKEAFAGWIAIHDPDRKFETCARTANESDMYYLAFAYSVPIIMVKYFKSLGRKY